MLLTYGHGTDDAERTVATLRTASVASLVDIRIAPGSRRHALNEVFKKVDFIALPTLQVTPPAIPWIGRIALLEVRVLNSQNTAAVNYAGNPALAVPVPVSHEHFPVTSLQLVGPRLSEPALLNAGRIVEAAVREKSP